MANNLFSDKQSASRTDGSRVLCDQCGGWLTGKRTRFCSDPCSNNHRTRKAKAVRKAKDAGLSEEAIKQIKADFNRPQHSRGLPRDTATVTRDDARLDRTESYELLDEQGLFEKLHAGEVNGVEAAQLTGMHQGTVSKEYKHWLANRRFMVEQAEKADPRANVPDVTVDNLDALVDHFATFRMSYFQTPDGAQYLFPPHQRKWLREILEVMLTGAKLEILSPPRHGKTELLAHVCVWLIACINPNIRIIVLGGNQDIAANSVGMVKDQLEDNEALTEHWCPTRTFRPKFKGGDPWTNEKFTVSTRTVAGIKSPTMIAIGRGGKILSRDADLIICDDIEDADSTMSADQREKTRRWWAITLMSRKEAKTGLVVIGSRQHPDDLYGHLLTDSAWKHIVEQIHDEACVEDEEDLDAHVDCMLWPEIRDYKYMRGMLADPTVRPHFAMVYMNQPQDAETSTFPRDLVDSCLTSNRTTGDIPDEPAVRLIAGLDPAGSGHQASFLWAVNQETGRRSAVDMDNRLGGGIQRIREVMEKWFEQYGCRYWVIENNAFQGAILRDEMLAEIAQRHSITIEGHGTYGNKWDPQLGVSTLANWMEAGHISIPWMTSEDQAVWSEYRRQLINFSRENTRRMKSDVVMASWFPEERIQEWIRNWAEAAAPDYDFDSAYIFDPLSYQAIA